MKKITPNDYPALVSAVERYLESEECPSIDAVCAILGIQGRKTEKGVDVLDINGRRSCLPAERPGRPGGHSRRLLEQHA